LDEPTNHLDLMMREALVEALQSYTGSMVLISHDRFLVRAVCDDLWLVAHGEAKPFTGDMDDYLTWLLKYMQEKNQTSDDKPKKSKPAKNRDHEINVQEQEIKKINKKLERVNEKLAGSELYTEDKAAELKKITLLREEYVDALHHAETAWFELTSEAEGNNE
jgi:ATP-binding cassette subfamily F protein 3